MEVEHVSVLETDVAAEVLAHDALPSWEELVVEELFELFGQVNVLELARALGLLLDELDCFQTHVYIGMVY